MTTKSKRRIAIIGGGFTGLAAATILSAKEHNLEVHVFEKRAMLGGLAAGFREPGWRSSLEYYYHHWFESDAAVKKFARIWGVSRKLFFHKLLTVMETGSGRFVPLDSAMSLLRYPDLGLISKLRMGFALAWLKFFGNWRKLEAVTAEAWCRKYMGEAGYNEIWKPLLVGKFGEAHAAKINMAWLWSRLKVRSPKLGSYQGGFQDLVQDAEAWLRQHGVQFHLNTGELQVKRPPDLGGSYEIRDTAGSLGAFDNVLIATSPHAFAALTRAVVDRGFLDRVTGAPALGVRVIVLSLKERLNPSQPFYWYSLRKSEEHPFLALIEHTYFVPETAFGNEHIVYLATYLDTKDKDWNTSDGEVLERAFRTCAKINPRFKPEAMNRYWIFREAYAQPLTETNASKNIWPLQVPGMSGLYFASMAHIYPWDRGTNFALDLGEKVATEILTQK